MANNIDTEFEQYKKKRKIGIAPPAPADIGTEFEQYKKKQKSITAPSPEDNIGVQFEEYKNNIGIITTPLPSVTTENAQATDVFHKTPQDIAYARAKAEADEWKYKREHKEPELRALTADELKKQKPWKDITPREWGVEHVRSAWGDIDFAHRPAGHLTTLKIPGELFKGAIRLWSDKQGGPIMRTVQQGEVELLNLAGFGFPAMVLRKLGYNRVQPETPAERVMHGIGALAGYQYAPMALAKKIPFANIPLLGRAFMPTATLKQATFFPIIRSGIRMGTANVLSDVLPNILDPKKGIEEFGSGAVYGAGLHVFGFIPSVPLRMSLSTAYMAIPSYLREDPLEMQVFNAGLGAWMGSSKSKRPRQVLGKEAVVAKAMREGVSAPIFEEQRAENEISLRWFKVEKDKVGKDYYYTAKRGGKKVKVLIPKSWKLKKLLEEGGLSYVKFNNAKEEGFQRVERANYIFDKLNAIKHARGWNLRLYDDLVNIVDSLPTKKSIEKLSTVSLFNLSEKLQSNFYGDGQKIQARNGVPLSIEALSKDKMGVYTSEISHPYAAMERLGLGGTQGGGVNQVFFDGEHYENNLKLKYYPLRNNWMRMVGAKRSTSKRIAMWLDGKNVELNQKEKIVAKQVRVFTDTILDHINRHRVSYGEEPIKAKKNYFTHIFDKFREEIIRAKNPMPEHLDAIMEFTSPEKKKWHFGKRYDVKGYQMDLWKALDAYTVHTFGALSDGPIRQAHRIVKWMDNEMAISDASKKSSPVDFVNLRDYVNNYAKSLVNTPTKFDRVIKNSLDSIWNKRVPPKLQIQTLAELNNSFSTVLYMSTMGYRPKLAIRNLGQNSLTLGETGMGPLVWGIREGLTAKGREIATHSKVLDIRKLHYMAEYQPNYALRNIKSHLTTSAFWMYRSADKINVTNAFLAGYREAKLQGKSDKDAYKRGDEVAGKTQYLYMKGNRSPFISKLGIAGRTMGVFTTWPIGWLDLQLSWAKPGERHKIVRYWTYAGAAIMAGAALGIDANKYTGASTPATLANMARLKLPITGVTENFPFPPQIIKDIDKSLKKDDLKELVFYTLDDKNNWLKKLINR